jgi:hypothetical protein
MDEPAAAKIYANVRVMAEEYQVTGCELTRWNGPATADLGKGDSRKMHAKLCIYIADQPAAVECVRAFGAPDIGFAEV